MSTPLSDAASELNRQLQRDPTQLFVASPEAALELARKLFDDGALDSLSSLCSASFPKATRKALRRYAHQLSTKGVRLPKTSKTTLLAPRAEPGGWCTVSTLDFSMAAVLVWPHQGKALSATLQYKVGQPDIYYERISPHEAADWQHMPKGAIALNREQTLSLLRDTLDTQENFDPELTAFRALLPSPAPAAPVLASAAALGTSGDWLHTQSVMLSNQSGWIARYLPEALLEDNAFAQAVDWEALGQSIYYKLREAVSAETLQEGFAFNARVGPLAYRSGFAALAERVVSTPVAAFYEIPYVRLAIHQALRAMASQPQQDP